MKIRTLTSFITLMFVCLTICEPKAHAVNPPPDGGYPGGNTAEGQNALLSRNTGIYNTAVGIYSILSLTDGNFCTGVGAGTLLANTADENTATGAGALFSNTTGDQNTANGTFALFSNTTGFQNTANGTAALLNNTTGIFNTATGHHALFNNSTGFENTASGYQALSSNTNGTDNTANGVNALLSNTTGLENTANGAFALEHNTTGIDNVANGYVALNSNTTGDYNMANGFEALFHNTTGAQNTAIGTSALLNNTTGNNNIALGYGAGAFLTTGDFNIDIGNDGVAADADTIRIGTVGTQTATFIAGISGATVPGGVAVIIDADGHLGTTVSSARFKDEIKPMDKASEAILALKPVTFHYKSDTTNTPQFGLIAEEVAEVNPDLVVRDQEGEIYTVRYEAVNAMLLNEFLKEHRKVEELKNDFQTTVTQQQKAIEALTAKLKEQAAQIQKVSAQLETSKSVPRLVAYDP